jgi:hypothetical protein
MNIPKLKLRRVKTPYIPGTCIGCWSNDHNNYLCGGGKHKGKEYPNCIDNDYGPNEPQLRYKHWYVVKINENIHIL